MSMNNTHASDEAASMAKPPAFEDAADRLASQQLAEPAPCELRSLGSERDGTSHVTSARGCSPVFSVDSSAADVRRATRQRLALLLRDMLNTEELFSASSSPDPQLSHALMHFRSEPSLFITTLEACEEDVPANPVDAALVVLQRTFCFAHGEETLDRRDPSRFDTTALALQGCQTFVDSVHAFCTQAATSMKNISPFLVGGEGGTTSAGRAAVGGGGGGALPAAASAATASPSPSPLPSASLIEELAAARERLATLSRSFVGLCSFVVRLQDQSKARLELEKRVDFLVNHSERISVEDRRAVGSCVCLEVEARMEQRVVAQFLKLARRTLSQDRVVEAFAAEWRRLWEAKKQDLADRALRLTDYAIAKVNEALTTMHGKAAARGGAQQQQQLSAPESVVRNKRSPEELAAERARKDVVLQELESRYTTSAPYQALSLAAGTDSSLDAPASADAFSHFDTHFTSVIAQHSSVRRAQTPQGLAVARPASSFVTPKKASLPQTGARALRAAISRPRRAVAAALAKADEEAARHREMANALVALSNAKGAGGALSAALAQLSPKGRRFAHSGTKAAAVSGNTTQQWLKSDVAILPAKSGAQLVEPPPRPGAPQLRGGEEMPVAQASLVPSRRQSASAAAAPTMLSRRSTPVASSLDFPQHPIS